jgi:hypothetical protein
MINKQNLVNLPNRFPKNTITENAGKTSPPIPPQTPPHPPNNHRRREKDRHYRQQKQTVKAKLQQKY